jgi:hypothetical protein
MKWTIWLGLLAAACGGGAHGGGDSTRGGTTPATTAGGTVAVAPPQIPTAGYDATASELNDHTVFERMRHRVRLARDGVAYLKLDGPRVDATGEASMLAVRPMYPVLAEAPDRVRIVVEDDHARLALWVERSDLAQTTLASVQVSDATGHAPAGAGVWLGAGASLDTAERKAAAGFHEIALRSPWIRASGYVPDAALGTVWVAGEHEGYEPTLAEDDAKPPVATGTTLAPTTVRATPDGGGAVVAEVLKNAPVRVLTQGATWSEVEIHIPRVRVKGFVDSSKLIAGDQLDDHRVGHGHGYGSSGSQIHVPTASCLYDAAGGAVAGLTLGDSDRYLHDLPPLPKTPGWWPVIINTDWGNVTAYVHDTASAADPKLAVLESCVKK